LWTGVSPFPMAVLTAPMLNPSAVGSDPSSHSSGLFRSMISLVDAESFQCGWARSEHIPLAQKRRWPLNRRQVVEQLDHSCVGRSVTMNIPKEASNQSAVEHHVVAAGNELLDGVGRGPHARSLAVNLPSWSPGRRPDAGCFSQRCITPPVKLRTRHGAKRRLG
jgi:hypothetical protein